MDSHNLIAYFHRLWIHKAHLYYGDLGAVNFQERGLEYSENLK